MAHDGLGLSAGEAGMTHSPETNEMLEAAMPFDRAFVDEEGIVATQEREIEEMDAFRTEEYGVPVPVPVPEPQGGGGGGGHGGGHSG